MKTLTKAEEQVMQILWDAEEGFVKDLLNQDRLTSTDPEGVE